MFPRFQSITFSGIKEWTAVQGILNFCHRPLLLIRPNIYLWKHPYHLMCMKQCRMSLFFCGQKWKHFLTKFFIVYRLVPFPLPLKYWNLQPEQEISHTLLCLECSNHNGFVILWCYVQWLVLTENDWVCCLECSSWL